LLQWKFSDVFGGAKGNIDFTQMIRIKAKNIDFPVTELSVWEVYFICSIIHVTTHFARTTRRQGA